MVYSPTIVMVLWYTATQTNGSFLELVEELSTLNVHEGITRLFGGFTLASPTVLIYLFGYMIFAAVLQLVMPGPTVTGPVTPKGNTPVYTDNGFYCYLVTMATFGILTYYLKMNGSTPTLLYDHFNELLLTLTLLSLVVCVMLMVKGYYWPTTTDHGTTGSLIFDFYWGTELYPRILGIDVKVFTNCRFGMTVWPLLTLIFSLKSYELHGFVDSIWVSTTLQMIYFTKFFWWEAGYMRTTDIMTDRAGYYICWGCLVYVPGFYTCPSLFLVGNPVILGPFWSALILLLGTASIAVNYLADWQKQAVRSSEGKCLVWGKPAKVIRAQYTLESGEKRESLLLYSGWWGVARHFHYLPEILLAFFWSVPAGLTHLMPFSYTIFLVILLVHRTYRDDEKCSAKYGSWWEAYCKHVPYKIIPGIF